MFDNLSEIIKKGDKGDIDSMIEFVENYDLEQASKDEPDIKDRRVEYLKKLVEANVPFAYQELAFFYEENKDFETAIPLLEKAAEFKNTLALEHLGKYFYFGEYVKQDYKRAYDLFSIAAKEEDSDIEHVSVVYPFVAHLFLAEMYRNGIYVEKDLKKASKHYGDCCWLSIQFGAPESDEMIIATYWNGLERLGRFPEGEYKKNVVEALSLLELPVDWDFADESILEKLGLSKQDFLNAYENSKDEIKKLYPTAKYIAVNAGKYVIAKGEADNQVFEFEDDLAAREYANKHRDTTNGSADESVKFVLNTETWETLYE